MTGVGSGVGPILMRWISGDEDRRLRIAIAVAYVVATIGMIIKAPLLGFTIFVIGGFIRGMGSGVVWVFSTQLLLQTVPNQVRGRVFATEFALFTLASAGGATVAGWALDYFDQITTVLWWMTGFTLIPLVLWVLWMALQPQTTSRLADAAE